MLLTLALRVQLGPQGSLVPMDPLVTPERQAKTDCLGTFSRFLRIWPTNAEFARRDLKDLLDRPDQLAQPAPKEAPDCLGQWANQATLDPLVQPGLQVRLAPMAPLDQKDLLEKMAHPVKRDPLAMQALMEHLGHRDLLVPAERLGTKVLMDHRARLETKDPLELMETVGNLDQRVHLVPLALMPNIVHARLVPAEPRKQQKLKHLILKQFFHVW